MKPHILRGSIWQYVSVVTLNVFHFGRPEDDPNSVPALILLSDLPELLFAITHDVKNEEDKTGQKRIYPLAIDSLTLKVESLIDHGKLPVFEQGTGMRVDEDTPVHDSDVLLIRLDDVERLCYENGIEVSHARLAIGEPITAARELDGCAPEADTRPNEEVLEHDSNIIHESADRGEWSYYDEELEVSDTTIPRIRSYMRKSAAKMRKLAADRLLGARELNNLLRVVAALLLEAKLDYRHPSATAKKILAITDTFDATVGLRTIEKIIKNIPQALKKRT